MSYPPPHWILATSYIYGLAFIIIKDRKRFFFGLQVLMSSSNIFYCKTQGSRKKSYFLSGLATKAFSSPPPRISGHRNFFLYIIFFPL